jgi:hypothetical protein
VLRPKHSIVRRFQAGTFTELARRMMKTTMKKTVAVLVNGEAARQRTSMKLPTLRTTIQRRKRT